MTQTDLAGRLGCSQSTISLIEKGSFNISKEEYSRVCRFLDLDEKEVSELAEKMYSMEKSKNSNKNFGDKLSEKTDINMENIKKNGHTLPSINIVMIEEWRLRELENRLDQVIDIVKNNVSTSDIPLMYTVKEACAKMKIGRSKFDSLIDDGILKYIKKGRKIYVYEESIKQYFNLQ